MATKLMKVVKGEKGYVPVKSNSHGGTDVVRANNGDYVWRITSIPVEAGWAQVTKEESWPVSDTKEYWIEASHLEDAALEESTAYEVEIFGQKIVVKVRKL